ncbi:hypothetical protein EVG20_g7929 [Dentipellis fragilis]|uniref:Glucosamine 6-phosphate N-acetyltransferase n=1 Tax=Dentipellis fragilis TaxID=205917 RepID=A0A4Y9Y959_9AGAM|nr:hypothetical protein EVG20_g7929 [Dentipellis fragilis]
MPSDSAAPAPSPDRSVRAIYIVGPSSTGKTTLCTALATHLGLPSALHITEVARTVMRSTSFTRADVGTLFLERKFGMQGKKLGIRIIQALSGISESRGSYKTILNCSDANIPFYEKCGFEKKENEMAKYANDRARTPRL